MEATLSERVQPAVAFAICLVVLAGLLDVGLLSRALF
jgi:hypothetical protein